MSTYTGNGASESVKDVDYLETSALVLPERDLGFNFNTTKIIVRNTLNLKTSDFLKEDDLSEKEISREDKDRFYKMTLHSDLL